MVINIGYMEVYGGQVRARIYYDPAWLEADPGADPGLAPLIDGPRGYCLDMTNLTGRNAKLVVSGMGGAPQTIQVGQGDPVETGPVSGRSRTAAQMAALGFTTRGDVGQVTLEPERAKRP
jgi:hypothetical protein